MNNENKVTLSPEDLQTQTGLSAEEIKKAAEEGRKDALSKTDENITVTEKGNNPIKIGKKMIDKFRKFRSRMVKENPVEFDFNLTAEEIENKLNELIKARKKARERKADLNSGSLDSGTEMIDINAKIREYNRQIQNLKTQRFAVQYEKSQRKFYALPHPILYMRYRNYFEQIRNKQNEMFEEVKKKIIKYINKAQELSKNEQIGEEDKKNLEKLVDNLNDYSCLNAEDLNIEDINQIKEIFNTIDEVENSLSKTAAAKPQQVVAEEINTKSPEEAKQDEKNNEQKSSVKIEPKKRHIAAHQVIAEEVVIPKPKDLKNLLNFQNYEEYFDEFVRQKASGNVKLSSLLSKDIFEAKKDNQELTSNLKDTEKQLADTEKKLSKSEETIEKRDKEIAEKNADIAKKEKAIESRNARIEKLLKEMEKRKKEIDDLAKQVDDLEEKVRNYQNIFNQASEKFREIDKAASEVNSISEEKSQLEEPTTSKKEIKKPISKNVETDQKTVNTIEKTEREAKAKSDSKNESQVEEVVTSAELNGNTNEQITPVQTNKETPIQSIPIEPVSPVISEQDVVISNSKDNTKKLENDKENVLKNKEDLENKKNYVDDKKDESTKVTKEETVEKPVLSMPVFDSNDSVPSVTSDNQASNIADELVQIMKGNNEYQNPLQYMAHLKEQEEVDEPSKGRHR